MSYISENPIGVFDSGVGGLSVLKEIIKVLPKENIIYYSDNANCPYGNKSQQEIINISSKIVDFLISKKVKLIVVACNTATASAIDFLRANYSIPFVGMEPAVKPAALNSKTHKIGILATKGTLEGRLFKETSSKFADNSEVYIQVGDGLVEIVENGKIDSPDSIKLLESYISPMIENGIDQLVLGCTHYPFLIEQIQKITKNKIAILDPAPAVAKRTADLLNQFSLENIGEKDPKYNFYYSKETDVLKKMINNIGLSNYQILLH